MFQKFKNIDTTFRQVRMVSILLVSACLLISLFSIYSSFRHSLQTQNRIYILANGKVLEAMAADRKDNLPVEARDHVRTFHLLFFSLEPDEKAIDANMRRALYLADGSAKRIYDNFKEAGFYSGIISGNISERVNVDSIRLDMDIYPFLFKCYATETLIRATTITTRTLVTEGLLRNTSRTENNPHGFLIEKLEVTDNRDLKTQNR